MIPHNDKKISIIGLGASGLAAAEELVRRGAKVFVSEKRQKSKIDSAVLRKLEALKINSEFGRHSKKLLDNCRLIVASPGVDANSGIFRAAKKRKIRIISEIELASSFLKTPIVAITGTNGKTTTVELTVRILKAGGKKTVAAGNIGYPLIKTIDRKYDQIVAEISSYQLEGVYDFTPEISVMLNITEDHLMRHKNMQNYSLSKARIFRNQKKGQFLVYNFDDKIIRKLSKRAKCNKIPFSVKNKLSQGVYLEKDRIIVKLFSKKVEICRASDIKLKGKHNLQNCMAAIAVAVICGVSKNNIRRTLRIFKGVEHRIEYVKKINGVSFYNDSKGTNPDSTIVAVNALYPDNGIVLILGGKDKKTDLKKLSFLVKKTVKNVVVLGEAAERIKTSLRRIGYKKISPVKTMRSAVHESFNFAEKGDAVLLSPACASFDMFKNYEERGTIFKRLVNELARRRR